MAFESLSEHLGRTANKSQDYLRNTAEYYKLRLFKSTMKMTTSLVHALILGSMFLLFLSFFSFAIAFVLGGVFDSMFWGFLVVSAFYLLLFVLIFAFGKDFIVRNMLSKFSDLMFEDEDIKEQHFEEDNVSHEAVLPKEYDQNV